MGLMNTIGRGLGVRWRASSDDDRVEIPPDDDDFWYGETGAKTAASIRVTPDLALKSAALYTVVRVLAETIATTSCRMRMDTPKGPLDAPDHPLDELIRYQPNRINTAVEFWEMMILHAALRGVGYAEIVPGPRGAVDQLIPLHRDRVQEELLSDGSLRFKVTNPHTGGTRILLQEEMFRIPGISSDGIKGLRAVDLAAEDIGLGMAADEYAARVFSNKMNIGGYLVHPGKLSKAAQKNLITALMRRFAGASNSHRPMLLQEGVKFERATMDAKDAQLLEARKWQVTLIAMRFRMPLHMLGIYDGATHSNVEQQALDLVRYTLRPWCKRIEQAIRRDLIVAKGKYFAEFNLETLLRGDWKARAEYFAKARGSGGHRPWLTGNEVRRIEGFPDIDGEDDLDPPINMQVGNVREEEEAQAPLLDRAAALIRKENAAIRKALMRFGADADAFRTWTDAFYGGHVSSVMTALGISKDAARAYCTFQKNELLQANDTEGLLDRREDSTPAQLARTIEQNSVKALT